MIFTRKAKIFLCDSENFVKIVDIREKSCYDNYAGGGNVTGKVSGNVTENDIATAQKGDDA